MQPLFFPGTRGASRAVLLSGWTVSLVVSSIELQAQAVPLISKRGAGFFAGICLSLFSIQHAAALDLFQKKDDRPGIFKSPSKPDKKGASAHLLQQEMMDFSDRYTMAIWQALDDYLRQETDPLKRSAAEHWKVIFSSASMEIAVGREPAGSLLDMAVFIDLADWVATKYWVPEVFGAGGEPLLRAQKSIRKDFDVILNRVLTPEPRGELNDLIRSYKQDHPKVVYVADVRLRDLSTERAGQERGKGGIPLLADVRHAVGEIDEALQYGERLMFYVERVTRLTTMQTALALAQAGSSPAVLSLTRSAETASSAIDRLPATITSCLEESTGALKELLPEIHATATETRGTAESVERIMKSLGDTPSDDPWTPSKTLSTLTEVRQAASEWNSTLKQLENTLSLVASNEAPALRLLSETESRTCQTVDYAYRKVLIAIAFFLAGQAVIVVLAARLFKSK